MPIWIILALGALLVGVVCIWALSREASPDRSNALHLPGADTFEIEITGEPHYQTELAKIAGSHRAEGTEHYCRAVLRPDPTNRLDSRAIRVIIDGLTVGYIRREYIDRLHARMAGNPVTCDAVIVRGGLQPATTGLFSVKLDIKWPLEKGRT